MNCLQKYFKAHPNAHDPISQGMCPDEFAYLDEPENCNASHGISEFPALMSCSECWCREIPEENSVVLSELRKELCRTFQVPEKILFGDKKEKKKLMRNATAQCVNCVCNDVCKYRVDLACISLAINDAVANGIGNDSSDVRVADIDFIYPIEVKCKYRHVHTETAKCAYGTATSATSADAPYTYTEGGVSRLRTSGSISANSLVRSNNSNL